MSADHRVVADSHLSRAAECVIELPLGSPDQMAYLATAQVHATLALAEQTAALVAQQKLANLIEWSTRDGYHPNAAMSIQISQGLGL